MASVTRQQFTIRSELEVVHTPTGAVFWAYPYSKPENVLESVRVNWGLAASAVNAGNYADKFVAWRRSCCLSKRSARRAVDDRAMLLEKTRALSGLLSILLNPGLSLGILLGALVIVSAWVLSFIYVRWANTHYDKIIATVSKTASAQTGKK